MNADHFRIILTDEEIERIEDQRDLQSLQQGLKDHAERKTISLEELRAELGIELGEMT